MIDLSPPAPPSRLKTGGKGEPEKALSQCKLDVSRGCFHILAAASLSAVPYFMTKFKSYQPSGALMDIKIISTVFVAIFIAELGDKTQLATLLFASGKDVSKMSVFIGASLALIAASGIGVLVGALISSSVNEKYLRYIAGAGFIAIGIWTLVKA